MHVWTVTGGIACGKSTVAQLFHELGAQIYSADTDARAVLTDRETATAVFAAFPTVRADDGSVDRKKLAAQIFGDELARKRLNAIMHPAIRAKMRRVIETARDSDTSGLLLYEVPLLYEGGLETWFDGVIAVLCSREAQLARLRLRDPSLSVAELNARLDAQLDPEEKARRANFTIRTDIALEATKAEVLRVFTAIQAAP